MFSVKHINMRTGAEQLAQGKYFLREQREDKFWQFTLGDDRDNYAMTWCGDVKPGDCDQFLYVMNEQGSTVARYAFTEPNFGEVAV